MKKLLTACAACVLAGMVSAQVESVNIVGYSSTGLTGGTFNMFSVQFESVGGSAGLNLNSAAFSGDFTSAEGSADADQILIWDPATSGYTIYYLYTDGYWYNFVTDAAFEDDYPNGLPVGTAFWYKAVGSSGEAVFTGQVNLDASKTAAISGGTFNMLTFPYPVGFKLNDATYCDWVSDGAYAAEGAADADQILIWDPATSGYAIYYLYTDGYWYNFVTDAAFEDDFPAGLPEGTAFWYQSKGAGFTVTFNRPF